MFYGKLLLLLLLLFYYYYYIAVNPKQYTGIDWYRNISFHWSNQYSFRYEIDFLECTTHQKKKKKSFYLFKNESKFFSITHCKKKKNYIILKGLND